MTLSALPLILLGATCLLLAVGRIPGLALARTGFAVPGALAFFATGEISLAEAKAANVEGVSSCVSLPHEWRHHVQESVPEK